ncbi:hypothetical protein DPX16_20524 [Anabarilius grahami]|uniref:Uncharacterized protein n=1 Tax=Anabarilius grahami TaxID=495550 RepID=A0A3N0YKU2_ANAGA|nr:hypothetical protein DPX16_20524 [Anabarilius grahami]
MTAAGKGHDMICQKAVSLIVDLCMQDSPRLDHDTCEEFLFLISNQQYNHKDSGIVGHGQSVAVDDGWKALHNRFNSQQMSKDEAHTVEKYQHSPL